jgi:tRNA (guanine-N7-)-methyltransferase
LQEKTLDEKKKRAMRMTLLESTPQIDWRALFGNTNAVEIEIGCGKGAFLIAAATSRPDTNFVGIDNQPRWARFVRERLAKTGLANVRVVAADATSILSCFVPDESVRAIHIYFPDPWWKRRHEKRRVVRRELATHLFRVLERGGVVHLATDVERRFHAMLEELAAAPFAAHAGGATIPDRPPTNFERKYRAEGRPIFTATLQKPP